MRRFFVLSLLLWAVDSASAQGVVNTSLLAPPADTPAAAAARRTWPSQVFERVQPSIVYVLVEVDGPRGKFVRERASSGIIVDQSGWIVTLHRLVAEAQRADDNKVLVQLNDADNTRLAADIKHVDDASGLVLLRVQPPPDGLTAVQLGADDAAPGEPVVVIARPEGKDMLAFAGVASPALAAVELNGKPFAAADVFLTDSRNDERCDGAGVFAEDGTLLGIYCAEHVRRDRVEPTLEELKQSSFGVVLPAARMRQAFATALADAGNATLLQAAARPTPPLAEAVARAAPSVVSVWAGDGDWPELGGDDPGAVKRRAGLGSGTVLTGSGLIVANRHVVADASGSVRVRTIGGDEFTAEVVRSHGSSNLALLQADLPAGQTLPAIACGTDGDLMLGEVVLAVGNPLGVRPVVTAGIVSAMRRREGGRVQADANLGNQNGGGAIIDRLGRLVGIGDAGVIDPIELAFRGRDRRVTQDTNLSTFVGIQRVREVFRRQLDDAAGMPEPPSAATADAEREQRRSALTAMVEQAAGAMLNIYVAKNVAEVDEDDPFAAMAEPELVPLSLGSGVIIDRSGLAISNWHVVDDATNPDGSMRDDHVVTARVSSGKTYRVRVLSISREDDLSLLQLELEPGEEVPAVELASSEELRIGEPVAAIGNPHGRANTITSGVVSAKDQGLRVRGRWAKLKGLIETDAAINGGNSGGALLDMAGRLVGINSAGGGTYNNKGYAIAVDHVRKQVVNLLFQSYKLRSPDLGMRVIDEGGRVLVLDVDERGPAARAGVRSGDRIVSLGGESITWSPGFALQLLQRSADVDVELLVERGGVEQTISVAPVAAATWSLIRQSGLRCRDVAYADDPERARLASIALHRAFTGDSNGEPQVIPSQFVAVERVFRSYQPDADIEAGDLILAIELRTAADGDAVLSRVGSVAELRDWFNHRKLGSYDAIPWSCWIARGNEVKQINIVAKRLLW